MHCWLVAYFVWAWDKPPSNPNHVYNRHPQWLTKDSIGQKQVGNGFYVDPGHPEANDYLLNIAQDVVSRYDIDGLHWDYLRYPNQDSGYNETALRRYKDEFKTEKDPLPNDPQFSEWRRRQVTDFLRRSTVELLGTKPKLVISASVFSNYKDSRDYRFADWVAWNKEGIIDVTVPMDFSPDNKFIFNPRADFAFTNQWNRMIYVGQGAYMNSKENTLAQLKYCREKGFKGTVFYSYRHPSGTKREKNVEERFEEPEQSPNDFSGVVIDNSQAEVVGPWKSGKYGKFIGSDYLFIEKGSGKNLVRFTAKLPAPGEYDVFEWHVAGRNRAKDCSFTIRHAKGTQPVQVNQQQNGSRWNVLGRFHFDGEAVVQITDAISDDKQVVVADAVRFVPATEAKPEVQLTEAQEKQRKEAAALANREKVFAFLKQEYQPNWENVPELSWKTKPTTGIIKGTVTRDGKPVYNAAIVMSSALTTRKQHSDPHGSFAFFEVAPGSYEISVEGDKNIASCVVKVGEISVIDLAR